MLSCFSHVQFFATPWTVAHQTPLSIGFSRQVYWSGLPFPIPGGLPHPWVKSECPASPAFAGGFFTTEPPGKPSCSVLLYFSRYYIRYPQILNPFKISTLNVSFIVVVVAAVVFFYLIFLNFILFLNFTILYCFCQISK